MLSTLVKVAVVVDVVLVVLQQASEDDPQKRESCAWKKDDLVTVAVYVLVIAVGGWKGSGMEMAVCRHAGQGQGIGGMAGDAGEFSECDVYTLITPDRTSIQVRSSG